MRVQTNPRSGPDAPSLTDGVDLLHALNAQLKTLHDAQVAAVQLAHELKASGTVEALEGMSLDLLLGLTHKQTAADRGMLLTAGDILATMPLTARLFQAGVLSWSQLRGIVGQARRVRADDRAHLDAAVAASAD